MNERRQRRHRVPVEAATSSQHHSRRRSPIAGYEAVGPALTGPRPPCSYWGTISSLAEEADGAGNTLVRCAMRHHRCHHRPSLNRVAAGHADPCDVDGTF
jgi:hypothetical protein